jgi:ferredoxin-NADP reductase
MSMLRDLAHRDELGDAVLLHSARTREDVTFGEELRELAARHEGLRLHEQHTAEMGRMGPEDLDELCPDWTERETFASGPGDMLDALTEHYERHGVEERLHMERFQPVIGGDGAEGEGGTIRFTRSDAETQCDGGTPILVAGEEAGLELPFGCRMGVCHTCIGRLESGRIRDLRSGEVSNPEGEMVRTCIHAPEGPVEIEL